MVGDETAKKTPGPTSRIENSTKQYLSAPMWPEEVIARAISTKR